MSDSDSDKTLAGEQGGGWTEDVHNALYPDNFNYGLASFVSQQIRPSSALEFGSGLGHLARHIADSVGVSVYDCIEPNPFTGRYRQDSAPKLHALDIFGNDDLSVLQDSYDLVISIEVAEHVERSLHTRLFDFLVKKAERCIVFSGARVGQGGHGHIAERNEEDWRNEFTSRGCAYDPVQTEAIRAACDEKNINHRRNLMVFNLLAANNAGRRI